MEYVAHSFNCRIENADSAEMLFREMSIIDVTNEQRGKERKCADTIYKCKKLNSLKHLVRTTVAASHN